MSGKNVFTQFTKNQNIKCGRKGYGMWKSEKITSISPKKYGMFILKGGKKHE